MSDHAARSATPIPDGGTPLLFPALAPFYGRTEPLAYALLRAAFGLTIVTHGVPKLLGRAHGSMADPMAGSINLITNVLNLPFAPQLAMFVALLETFGGLAVAVGLVTRLFAPMLAVQMAAISVALAPTYPWIDRGIEYPLMLGFVALLIAVRGGGAFSVDRRIGREL
ncbi:DoxX family protein [Azospirillum sp. ST 5-10]|uniref:DoxX family protein n=1 Tax=unclassified Azospirillum TaxID=2630922 RepID=UPI003F49BD45